MTMWPIFAGGAVEAGIELAIDDQARADAGAEKDADDMLRFGFEFGFITRRACEMLQSFSTKTGTSSCFSSSFFSGTSFQPRLGAKMTRPVVRVHRAGRANRRRRGFASWPGRIRPRRPARSGRCVR